MSSTPMVVSLGGVAIKQPTDLEIELYDLTKSGRLGSGKMVIDIIAKKRKFNFTYEVLSGAELEKIKSVIDSMNPFVTLVYIENGVQKSAVVYRGALKYRRFRTDGVWYWKNVTFSLIEQ